MQEEKQNLEKVTLTKSQQNAKYKKHFACVLTHPEGKQLSKIIADHKCDNLSQLCKKIVHGEVQLRTVKQKIPNPD